MSRLRVLEQGPNTYTMIAQSGPGKFVPAEAAGFFDSIRFDGKPAVTKQATEGTSSPAKRKVQDRSR